MTTALRLDDFRTLPCSLGPQYSFLISLIEDPSTFRCLGKYRYNISYRQCHTQTHTHRNRGLESDIGFAALNSYACHIIRMSYHIISYHIIRIPYHTHTKYIPNTGQMHIEYEPNTSQRHTKYIPDTYQIHTRYRPPTGQVPTEYITYQIHTKYIPHTYQLRAKYIPNTCLVHT